MDTLTRYIAREFAKLLVMCLASFVFLYLLVDFIEQSNTFLKNDPGGGAVLMYFAYKVPLILFQILPPSILLATLLTLTILAKNSEIVAMLAGGVSLYRIVAPILVLATCLSVLSFVLNEYVVPYTTQRAETIKREDIKGKEKTVRKRNWIKSQGSIYNIRRYYLAEQEMRGVSIYEFDDEFRLTKRIDAETGVWTGDGVWEFRDGTVRTFADGQFASGDPFDALPLRLKETPDDLSETARTAEQMTYRELQNLIAEVESEGADAAKYKVDLANKIAFPMVGVIMALLAIPFSLRGGRRGGVAVGIAMAVAIGVVYWLLMGVFLSLGTSGTLPPVVAAWAGHVLFGAAGLALLVRVPK